MSKYFRISISALALCFCTAPSLASELDYDALRSTYSVIDALMGGGELASPRERSEAFDFEIQAKQELTFADQITRQIRTHLSSNLVHFAGLDETFHIAPGDERPISLISHPICSSTRSTLIDGFRKTNALLEEEVGMAVLLENRLNAAREHALSTSNYSAYSKIWAAVFGCLAYTESLGDPDTPTSFRRAQELLGNTFEKPPGVKFYYDKSQSNEESRWNIGLYQFVLHKGGNIWPCLNAWKAEAYPSYNDIASFNMQEMGELVGSPHQSFNAFCGVNKLVQTFYVQAYTTEPNYTHPNNVLEGGKVRTANERCVSPFVKQAYSHFGPLTRSVVHPGRTGLDRSNFAKLLSCATRALED